MNQANDIEVTTNCFVVVLLDVGVVVVIVVLAIYVVVKVTF